jgi:hypothetical protein
VPVVGPYDDDGPLVTLPLDWNGHVGSPVETKGPVENLDGSPGTDLDRYADGYLVPGPRRPAAAETLPGLGDSPLARMVLARASGRPEPVLDSVTFTAPCPGCGRDCTWKQQRQDTRVRSTVDCSCR